MMSILTLKIWVPMTADMVNTRRVTKKMLLMDFRDESKPVTTSCMTGRGQSDIGLSYSLHCLGNTAQLLGKTEAREVALTYSPEILMARTGLKTRTTLSVLM